MSPGGGGGEKTEKATPKKRKDAREKGQVLKSQEVNTALSLLLMFVVLKVFWSFITDNSMGLLRFYLSDRYAQISEPESAIHGAFMQAIIQLITILAPVLIAALVIGIVTNIMQTGFLFTTKALAPKMDRINPLQGFKRIFSMRSIAELLKSLLKIGLITAVAYSEISRQFGGFKNLMTLGALQAFSVVLGIAFDVGIKISAAMIVVAAVDFGYQWWKYEKDLKMTKQEVKDEYKQTEGNPEIKGRIKQKQRQMASMRMMQSVPDADVIITNPTHYAVALKYDEKVADAPMVLAKGKDYIARKIKELAAEHDIEMVENKPVAQALYAYCDVGDKIPEDMFQAVAEILAYVYRRREDMTRGVG